MLLAHSKTKVASNLTDSSQTFVESDPFPSRPHHGLNRLLLQLRLIQQPPYCSLCFYSQNESYGSLKFFSVISHFIWKNFQARPAATRPHRTLPDSPRVLFPSCVSPQPTPITLVFLRTPQGICPDLLLAWDAVLSLSPRQAW